MAIFNEILAPRYARMLQKLLSMKGAAPARQLSGEVMPTLPLFNGAENRFLEGWNRFGAAPVVVAVAAQDSVINLRNPSGGNVVVVLEKLAMTVGVTAVAMNVFNGVTADLGTIVPVRRIDSRGPATSAMVVSSANNVGTLPAANQIGIAQQALGVTYDAINCEDQEIVLLPGDGLQMSAGNNAQLSVWLIWRERALEESERTG